VVSDVGQFIGLYSGIVALSCSDILVHRCGAHPNVCPVLLLFGFPGIIFCHEDGIILLDFPHEHVIVDSGRQNVFIFKVVMGMVVGVGGPFVLRVLVSIEVVFIVGVDPRIVFIGSVVQDLILYVWGRSSFLVLEALDMGDNGVELHADAFGLLIHAVL
jgi:hypothetical protein